MNLPKVLEDLTNAQNQHDSTAYANCFTESSVVFDEGKTHTGKTAIKNWIEKANQEYNATMKPLNYAADRQTLKAEIAGTFPGSPAVLTYQFEIQDGKITRLKIG